ncbi:hypothetical protein [Frigoriglobus tundricola]|uniref:Uncharacterized protein n=1 Tax=Frigoriglobus tundricola TaxID=2774151 RepID=A0A6M5YL97_9BACT|nr:hypothetical protein [Frigoriglobus tundricola]QJW94748.1 hypothetical protein FTUN_2270 [Frigoriglobus tundricola]
MLCMASGVCGFVALYFILGTRAFRARKRRQEERIEEVVIWESPWEFPKSR